MPGIHQASPAGQRLTSTRSHLRGTVSRLCARRAFITRAGTAGTCGGARRGESSSWRTPPSLTSSAARTTGGVTPSGRRQRAGIQSIVEAIDNGTEPRCSGDNMRKVLEIAIGFRESHRNGYSCGQVPHRGQEPEDRAEAGMLAEQEGGLRGGGVRGDDLGGGGEADCRGGFGLGGWSGPTLCVSPPAGERSEPFDPSTSSG